MARIILCGNKWLLQRGFALLHDDSPHQVVAVLANADCRDDDTLGVLDRARQAGICTSTANINTQVATLYPLQADAVLSLQYRSLIKPPVLDLTPRGCLNLHFGLLPDYRGCHVVAWAILNREEFAGVTLHQMDAAFDQGDIYSERRVPITPDTTAKTLFAQLNEAALEVLSEDLDDVLSDKLRAAPQPPGDRYYRRESLNFAADKFLNWRLPGEDVLAHYQAFFFPPLQYPCTRAGDDVIELTGAARLRDDLPDALPPGQPPGLVVPCGRKICVATGSDQWLEIDAIGGQPASQWLANCGGTAKLQASDFSPRQLRQRCRQG